MYFLGFLDCRELTDLRKKLANDLWYKINYSCYSLCL